MKKLGIFFTTRNNYDMLEDWLKTTDYEGFEVLNIDEDSTPEQKTLGKQICEKYNIKYLDRDKRGFWRPNKKLNYGPVLVWPFKVWVFLKWLFGYPGFIFPWNAGYVAITVIAWFYLTPSIEYNKFSKAFVYII